MSMIKRVLFCGRSLFIAGVQACLESAPRLVLEQMDPQPGHIRGQVYLARPILAVLEQPTPTKRQ